MSFNGRGVEDIQGILQGWTDGFEKVHGRKVTKTEMLNYLEDLREKRIQDSFKTQFSDFRTTEIDIALELIEKYPYNIEQDETVGFVMDQPIEPFELDMIQTPIVQSMDSNKKEEINLQEKPKKKKKGKS